MRSNVISPEVMLHIFNPYETFTPKAISTELIDLSMKSVRLRTIELTREECEMLVEERMLTKVLITASFLKAPLELKADIFWANYVVRGVSEPPFSDLGLNLRQVEAGTERSLRWLVEYWGAAHPDRDPPTPPDPGPHRA